MPRETPLDELRADALGLVDGERALATALQAIREEGARAAEAYRAVVRSLAVALEARDGYTGAHSDVVRGLSVAVGRRLGLDRAAIGEVEAVALLHDIGKIGVPDHILHKRGPLDDGEWALMREHPVIGERILRPLPGLAHVATGVRHEHERWDGTGYPDGLAGEDIPVSSRIVLACDAWSALVSARPYRAALSIEAARAELARCAGAQFDPDVVTALLACLEEGVGDTAVDADPGDLLGVADGDREARRLEREVHALIAISSAVATAESFEDVVEIAADEACRAIAADSLSISRWEADARMLRVIVNAGQLAAWEQRRPADETYRLDDDDALRLLLLDGRAYCTSLDDPHGFPVEQDLLRSLGKHSCAAVPIALGGAPWGELWAARGAGVPTFDERDVRFLRTVAGQLAAAAGRTELYARMADLAFRDSLTGVGNRRGLEERLDLAVHEAIADGRDLVILLCDLDHLKELNDGEGHQAGDDALRRVAEALVVEAGDEGDVYRVGGDEFCLVLPDGGSDRGEAAGARIRARLAGDGRVRPVSVSCGVASLAMGARRPSDLLRAADAAQYVAKRSGRGRVCLADPDPARGWRQPTVRRGRRRRERRSAEIATLVDSVTGALDGRLARADQLQRILEVVGQAAVAATAARTAVSFARRGAQILDVVSMVDLRRGRAWQRELVPADAAAPVGYPEQATVLQAETHVIADYPATAAILERGGAFVVDAADPDADPAERALLVEFSLDEVLVAAAPCRDGAWLLEVYGDERSRPLGPLVAAVRLLALEAVRGSVAPIGRTVAA